MSDYFTYNGQAYVLRRDLTPHQAMMAAYFGFDDKLCFTIDELDSLETAYSLENDVALQVSKRPEDFDFWHYVEFPVDGIGSKKRNVYGRVGYYGLASIMEVRWFGGDAIPRSTYLLEKSFEHGVSLEDVQHACSLVARHHSTFCYDYLNQKFYRVDGKVYTEVSREDAYSPYRSI